MTLSPGLVPLLAALGFGFACGSIPFGYLVGLARGVDVRHTGSRSIGFTNVQRTVGLAWGIPVLLLDIAKGAVPAMAAHALGLAPAVVGLGAWGAVLGLWSVPLDVGYIATLLLSGYVSVSSLGFALLLTPVAALTASGDPSLVVPAVVTSVVVIWRHVDNISRLSAGTEPRLGLWLKLFRRK